MAEDLNADDNLSTAQQSANPAEMGSGSAKGPVHMVSGAMSHRPDDLAGR
jgi:hypothetical protein